MSRYEWIVGVIFLIVSFITGGFIALDPDFGWHLRMGQIILAGGVPKTDPFSYTMPSFPFVDHGWLADVLFALLYDIGGLQLIALLTSSIALFAFLISIAGAPAKTRLIPILLSASILLSFVGTRPLVFSWFFMMILLRILLDVKLQRFYLTLPILFLVWVNIHGGFAAGIVAFLAVIMAQMWQQRKINVIKVGIFLLTLLVTFINPYGLHMWREVWMSISDSSLRWEIAEWKPAVFVVHFPFALLVVLSIMIVVHYRSKFTSGELILFLGLLVGGISSIRHIPLWTLMAMPLTIKGLNYFFLEAKKYKLGKERFLIAHKILVIIVLILAGFQLFFNFESAQFLSQKSFYPEKAVDFLKRSPSSGQIFSEYNWGGYLIWQLPEKKVFIDGRMPSWRWNEAPPTESDYAFRDYNDILIGKEKFERVIAKYQIDTVLLAAEKQDDSLIWNAIEMWGKDIMARFNKEESSPNIREQLKTMGWVVVYSDSAAVIYRKE